MKLGVWGIRQRDRVAILMTTAPSLPNFQTHGDPHSPDEMALQATFDLHAGG